MSPASKPALQKARKPMKRLMLRKCIGMSVLGVSLIAGCRHCRCRDCCTVCECAEPKVVAVAETQPSPYSSITLSPTKPVEPEVKPAVQPVVAQEAKPEYESVQMTMIVPDAAGAGAIPATVSLTPAEAKAMGIRPGYTPGALAVPAKAAAAPATPAVIKAAPTGGDVLPEFPPPPKDEE